MELGIFALPQACLDGVFGRLSSEELYACSLSCRAWRWLPANCLQQLHLRGNSRCSPQQVQHMRQLQSVEVHSGAAAEWPAWAAALQQHPPPGLHKVTLHHTSSMTDGDLQLLERVMSAQVPGCALHLAVNSCGVLPLLLYQLPWPWPLHLDFNVPYLSADAPALLQQVVTRQQGLGAVDGVQGSGQLQQHQQRDSQQMLDEHKQQQQQQIQPCEGPIASSSSSSSTRQWCRAAVGAPCTMSLWVCCWGGCLGLPLSAALQLSPCLPPGTLVGLSSLNCGSSQLVNHLTSLTGLTALELNFLPQLGDTLEQGEAPTAAQVVAAALLRLQLPQGDAVEQQQQQQQPGVAGPAGLLSHSSGTASTTSSSSIAGTGLFHFTKLVHLAGSLQQLCLYGSPKHGWTGSSSITALTGLTKLSLQRDKSAAPVELDPLSVLTQLRELHVERRVARRDSLVPLGQLTGLTGLSVVLDMQPDELAMPSPWQELRAHCGGLASPVTSDGEGDGSEEGGSSSSSRRQGWDGSSGDEDWDAADDQILNSVSLWWLRQLQQLRQLSLQVPEVDLSDLPPSLRELDMQKYEDQSATHTFASGPVVLPHLQRCLLPRPLAGQQRRQLAGVVVALAAGAPRLKHLDLFLWSVPVAAVALALQLLPQLQELALLQPRGVQEQQQLQQLAASRGQRKAVAGGGLAADAAVGDAAGQLQSGSADSVVQLRQGVQPQERHRGGVALRLYPPLPMMFWV